MLRHATREQANKNEDVVNRSVQVAEIHGCDIIIHNVHLKLYTKSKPCESTRIPHHIINNNSIGASAPAKYDIFRESVIVRQGWTSANGSRGCWYDGMTSSHIAMECNHTNIWMRVVFAFDSHISRCRPPSPLRSLFKSITRISHNFV